MSIKVFDSETSSLRYARHVPMLSIIIQIYIHVYITYYIYTYVYVLHIYAIPSSTSLLGLSFSPMISSLVTAWRSSKRWLSATSRALWQAERQ